ncbi:response regulator [Larkinella soli]|uniref:response regulator n=1 Tax=Larkinella soli TaxID=1770527 RepID=UPI000FFCB3B2|nr:response regulator [Larkinella soli]
MNTLKKKTTSNRKLKSVNILVIEDNPDQWLLIRKAIEQTFGIVDPVWIPNEQQALRFLNECETVGVGLPQLVLLDLYMPEKEHAWNVLKHIRESTSSIIHVPVVVFSSSNLAEDIAESYDRGGTSYVIKPMEMEAWLEYFQTLKEYWWEISTLPETRPLY